MPDSYQSLPDHLVSALFAAHGITAAWTPLPATGVVNLIYATQDVVLRVPRDRFDGIADARTESVAAPAAHAAGILTPRLIAFDDTRRLVDRPFSLWERVHAETAGSITLAADARARLWREVGRELSRLHHRVVTCADPHGYLEATDRDLSNDAHLRTLVDQRRVDATTAKDVERLLDELRPHVTTSVRPRFVHNDVFPTNLMCTTGGELRAILDWGDAGWGDPTLDFAGILFESMPDALEGYQSEHPASFGRFPAARFVWDKLDLAIEIALGDRRHALHVDVKALRAFLDRDFSKLA